MSDIFRELEPRSYGAIMVDPPWKFRTYTDQPSSRSAPYQTMTFEQIASLPVMDLARPDGCHLFMWTTGPHLPMALSILKMWGFKYSGIAFTWIKLKRSVGVQPELFWTRQSFHTGLGYTTRKNAEFCLLARRGNARRVAKDVPELIISPRREHSRKPDEAYARVERYTEGPYLDLFARSPRPGWQVWGNETEKFNG
jgi:N6-adenosine-specific RNA methylase IME4